VNSTGSAARERNATPDDYRRFSEAVIAICAKQQYRVWLPPDHATTAVCAVLKTSVAPHAAHILNNNIYRHAGPMPPTFPRHIGGRDQ
jgi:hypothetical protein